MDDVRRISRNLRPSVLDDLGFLPAVRTLIDDLQGRKRIDIRLEVFDGPLGVSPQVELAMYRVVQECLTNIERHSKASAVQVGVTRSDAEVVITVKDNGIGLLKKRRRPKNYAGGMGLSGMKERAELSGGRFVARSGKGRGTVVTAEFPLTTETATEKKQTARKPKREIPNRSLLRMADDKADRSE
jgi:two-component system NarL family sensor kinase